MSQEEKYVKPIKIKFDPNQDYQIEAVDAACSVFEGFPEAEEAYNPEGFELKLSDPDVVPNHISNTFLNENEFALLANVNTIREKYLPKEGQLSQLAQKNSGNMIFGTDYWDYNDFTINMETGTGKTYVYLRTIYQLHELYGLNKFIIIVPSIAIYEGVLNTFEATKTHFKAIFKSDTVPTSIMEYDGNHPEICKTFATSQFNSILLMTIQSFNRAPKTQKANAKSDPNIYKMSDKLLGTNLRPINYLQQARPILILDESQNYEQDNARRALRTLMPLCAFRYSATPGNNPPNEIYRLSSFNALQRNLVKQIQIFGTEEKQSGMAESDYIKVVSINSQGRRLTCTLEVQVKSGGALAPQQIEFSVGQSLKERTKNPEYKDITVENIINKEGKECVVLSNGLPYAVNETSCASLTRKAVFKDMITNTLKAHLEKKHQLESEGYGDVKVLSLFFIDKVASYNGEDPVIKNLFDDAFNEIKAQDEDWKDLKPEDVRTAYFAQMKKDKKKDAEDVDVDEKTTDENEKAAIKEAYDLIMKKKERLLSKDEPKCFIFAHSALREGWDNPNVFQICALREITSENSRRQTIGRGLRLPVNQAGERIHNHDLNVLTVVANESYERYADKLQLEYDVADGITNTKVFKDYHDKKKAHLNKEKFDSPDFQNLWNDVSRETDYTIKIDTDRLIEDAINAVNKLKFNTPVHLVTTQGSFKLTKFRIKINSFEKSGKVNGTFYSENTDGVKEEQPIAMIKGKALSSDGVFVSEASENVLSRVKVEEVHFNEKHPDYSEVVFDDSEEVYSVDDEWIWESQTGTSSTVSQKGLEDVDLPKFNLIQRTADETNLTRNTILKIFKGIEKSLQMEFLKNPEAFAKEFIATIKEVLTNHVVSEIEFNPTDGYMDIHDKTKELFPEEKEFPEKELVDGSATRSIYDFVQVDSNVERNFVATLNNADAGKGDVLLYFKFPPKYKIRLPRMIQNYNPDWAILRRREDKIRQDVIRETKGTEDLDKLRFTNEKRKILCAKKHFEALGIEYRPVNDKDVTWYKPWKELEKDQPDLWSKEAWSKSRPEK